MAPGSATYSLLQASDRDRERNAGAVLCPPTSCSATLAPQPPGHPPEANMEFPDWEEEPPSSLEAGGEGFPGILLHNGPAISPRPTGMDSGAP